MSEPLSVVENNYLDRRAILRKPKEGALTVVALEDIFVEEIEKGHFIKGVFAWNETSGWIAPPGGLKSALMASGAMHLATGKDWFGKKNKCAVGVVYFALERADLVKRRLAAHRIRMGIPRSQPIPVVIIAGMLDGMNPATVPLVVEAVRRAEAYFESFESGVHMAGLLIFDTFAKLIAAGGGDENSAKDQGRVFANIQKIKDQLDGPHVALIGHTGKDESRGARGSNAIYGDVDMMVEITGGEVRTATITKANDAPEGPLFSFKSEVHEFCTDEDDEAVTVNVVVEASPAHPERGAAGPKLKPNQQTVFAILHAAGAAGLTLEDWNAQAKEAGIGTNRKADLTDIRNALASKGLIREYAGRWKVNHGGE